MLGEASNTTAPGQSNRNLRQVKHAHLQVIFVGNDLVLRVAEMDRSIAVADVNIPRFVPISSPAVSSSQS